MQAFKIHNSIVEDYKNYLNSFTLIKNERIREKVDEAFVKGVFLPEALIQFNPSFKSGESLSDLVEEKLIHQDLRNIFGSYSLYQHQVSAIRKGVKGESFVVTSGTGSGKSLIFLATIFNSILSNGTADGIKAIIVYPMNALINSQEEEIKKYEINYLRSYLPVGVSIDESNKSLDEVIASLKKHTSKRFPITYGKYTGQENAEKRDHLKELKPDIILTNYMMLELIMTRNSERWVRESMTNCLEYLVFDELHTYRGRQGSDVSLLIRRIRGLCRNKLVSIGTSATMASSGPISERKKAIADVASTIFNDSFNEEQVIGETLDTCTNFPGTIPSGFDLQEALVQKIDPTTNIEKFINHKLAIWLENKIALIRHKDGTLERANPLSLAQIARELSKDTGDPVNACEEAILDLLQWSENLNIEGAQQSPRKSYLPIKIHQFISQTGNVYVSLEPKAKREITMETGRYIRVQGNDRPIFPVLFSRYSGYDFICVRKAGNKLIPRNPDDLPPRITKDDLKGDKETRRPRRQLTENDFQDGYIIIPEEGEEIWCKEDEDYLPESWFNKKDKNQFDNFYEFRLPKRIYFDQDGNFANTNNLPYSGWYMPARLLFDPTSGTIFDLRTNENTKLMRLGNEGRSTATTITSFSVIKSLNDQNIPIKNQKLLSFTDNRQDASLQAGHFNDFLMLGRLRSAIYYALKAAPGNSLNFDTISDQVYRTLNVPEEEYARIPSRDPGWPDPENEKAFKDYILLRIFYDLKRGWRYNTPNLEQCGLLDISYYRIEEFCQQEPFFENLELFKSLKSEERVEILIQILNFFRTSYAFEHYKLLDKRAETEERLKNRLDENKLWSLDTDEKIDVPFILLSKSVGDTNYRTYTSSIGPNSYLGKYFKRLFIQHNLEILKGDEYIAFIDNLCEILERGHFLKSELVRGSKGECLGYRLRIDQVIWKLGNGIKVIPDEVRIASFREVKSKPNDFFKKFYQQDFSVYKRTIIGKEHTGQLNNDDRIDREEKFRQGFISALFCSPTMELGIDISELNVVHMRNVPPNPANYAQRSGRSGRSGQAALVFTYCSNGSPH
ncbi:DEAD/DEAH box helicase, partial [Candidatus Nomurabacteria bacterium]|nr:DEAD/DEAH box helicase [Candidatus Nomurabacteria bacterium]